MESVAFYMITDAASHFLSLSSAPTWSVVPHDSLLSGSCWSNLDTAVQHLKEARTLCQGYALGLSLVLFKRGPEGFMIPEAQTGVFDYE